MNSTLIPTLAGLLLFSCGDSEKNTDEPLPDTSTFFEAVTVDELSDQVTNGFVTAMEKPSMTIGYIELSAGESAERTQTTFDEVFFIFDGSGTLTVGETILPIAKNETIMVAGNQDSNISTDGNVRVILVTMKENSFSSSTGFKHFTSDQITTLKTTGSNTWNPFLKENNVQFGLYSLPQSLGGDQSLTHTWEELNIITTGSSQFSMKDQSISVKRGSIVFVNDGIGHFFNQLSSSIDIMILWEQ